MMNLLKIWNAAEFYYHCIIIDIYILFIFLTIIRNEFYNDFVSVFLLCFCDPLMSGFSFINYNFPFLNNNRCIGSLINMMMECSTLYITLFFLTVGAGERLQSLGNYFSILYVNLFVQLLRRGSEMFNKFT